MYMKAVSEKEAQQRKKDEEEARKQLRTKQFNMDGLNHQMLEKEVSKKVKEIEELRYAE